MAEKKTFDHVMCRILHTSAAIALFAQSAYAADDMSAMRATAPLQGKAEDKQTHLEGGAETKESHLEGSAETKAQSASPLEGKLEQTAPLESELSDEQIKMQALENARLDQAQALNGQAAKDGKHAPLEGRLEQIGTPNTKLPVELTTEVNKNKALADIVLIKETPQLAEEPKLLEGNLTRLTTMASFPDFIVGTWGGHLKVLTRYLPEPLVSDPRIIEGEEGVIVVRFIKEDNNNVTVIPPSAFFQRRTNDRERHTFRRDGDMNYKEDLKAETYQDYPIIHMGSQHWHNAIGGQWQDTVVHHSLQRIGKKGAEQDTVFERTKDGALTGYRETIARYTWIRKKKIFMQAAVIDFNVDRTVRKSTTLEGFIVPKWHPYAEKIAGIAKQPWENINKISGLEIEW